MQRDGDCARARALPSSATSELSDLQPWACGCCLPTSSVRCPHTNEVFFLCFPRGGAISGRSYEPIMAILLFSCTLALHARQVDVRLRLDYLWAAQARRGRYASGMGLGAGSWRVAGGCDAPAMWPSEVPVQQLARLCSSGPDRAVLGLGSRTVLRGGGGRCCVIGVWAAGVSVASLCGSELPGPGKVWL